MKTNGSNHEEAEHLSVSVGKENYTAHISIRNHEYLADEPASLGGNDNGPNPYELLLSAVGACTAMTLRMYANRKNWPLEGVNVKLTQEKIYAEDCVDCDNKNAKIDLINKRIELIGDLDEKQRARLMQIADRCPVHRTLLGEVKIVSKEEIAA